MSGTYINNAGVLQKNITLQNIIQIHEAICSELTTIQENSFGDIFEIEINQTTLYPLAHLSIENANYSTHELTYNLRLYVMDLVQKDESNENDVLSDTMQTIGDYISKLKHSSTINSLTFDTEHDFRINDNISCEPFTERFDAEVSGWTANISITVSFNAGNCVGDTM